MAEVVYVLGAGINQGVKDFDGLGPPISSNFFQLALKHARIGHEYYKVKRPNRVFLQRKAWSSAGVKSVICLLISASHSQMP